MTDELPANLERRDILYSKNIGAYSGATSTWFNGFPPEKVVHVSLYRKLVLNIRIPVVRACKIFRRSQTARDPERTIRTIPSFFLKPDIQKQVRADSLHRLTLMMGEHPP